MSRFNNDMVELAIKIIENKIEYNQLVIDQFKEDDKNDKRVQIWEIENLNLKTSVDAIKRYLGTY